ncbi:MAG: 50S ribosomal protein L32 [Patescibacteria group bacterium]|jgi:large subunit ribosomal protein L32
MAEPKKRLTSARSGNRRAHLLPKKISLALCPQCKSSMRPHHICKTCGFYKGTDVLKLEEKARQKEERRKAREQEESKSTEKK